MSEKYLRILTILGLLAVIAVQGLWLVNTYRIIEGQIAQSAARKFAQDGFVHYRLRKLPCCASIPCGV